MECPECLENADVACVHDVFLSQAAVEVSSKTIIEHRNPQVETIKRFDVLPSYAYIFENFLMKNVPFILGKTATIDWRSRKDWVTQDGKPKLTFLAENFGHVTVPVADCKREQYSSQPKCDMKLGEYIHYWESYIRAGYPPSMESLYLKDWHFTRDFPGYCAYTTPNYFISDWLNEFWDCRSDEVDDYRFVYMGPKGSWTPFHADVFRSFSWSSNICGQKKWILFPPGEEDNLRDNLGNLVYDVLSADLKYVNKYPRYQHVSKRFEVYQGEGEIIYVPSGWHHQVHNVEDTISINHNWINGCNIDLCWSFLAENLADVQQEIADCAEMDGWNEHCQVILKASSGINFDEFFRFISTIATSRLESVKQWCDWIGKTDKGISEKLTVDSSTKAPQESLKTNNISCDSKTRGSGMDICRENVGVDAWTFGAGRKMCCTHVIDRVCDSECDSGSYDERNMDGAKAVGARRRSDASCKNGTSCDRMLDECDAKNNIRAAEGCAFCVTTSNHTQKEDISSDCVSRFLSSLEQWERNVNLDDLNSSVLATRFRISQMDHTLGSGSGHSMVTQNITQVLFDLRRLEYVLSSMLQNTDFSSVDFGKYSPGPEELLLILSQVLKNINEK